MHRYNGNIYKTALGIILLVVGFYAGFRAGENRMLERAPVLSGTEEMKPAQVDFSSFWRTWNLLQEKFVPTSTTTLATDQDKVWGAIQGLASSYKDPYTVFLPPVQAEIFQDDVRGNFEGVGMEVAMKDGALTVIAPLKDTPAYKAGIKAGDVITKIDGKNIVGFSTEQAIAMIRGKKGTPVKFEIYREGNKESLEIVVIRDTIAIPTISTKILPDGIFDIELYNFSASSPELFRRALREFIDARTDKLILDLRGNPGGYLEAAIDMASWFLPIGKPVVTEDFGKKQEPVIYRSKGYDIFNDKLRMVILIDNGSASASEILAGALREHGIAVLAGEKSFGKGSVQELVSVTGDTSLKVTVARWLTPDGTSISAQGIEPDFKVTLDKDLFKKGVDSQVQRAVNILKDNSFWQARQKVA
ncbi:MAG TPA: S41 family peptidase [Candidatus Paceibacterota bacterium]